MIRHIVWADEKERAAKYGVSVHTLCGRDVPPDRKLNGGSVCKTCARAANTHTVTTVTSRIEWTMPAPTVMNGVA